MCGGRPDAEAAFCSSATISVWPLLLAYSAAAPSFSVRMLTSAPAAISAFTHSCPTSHGPNSERRFVIVCTTPRWSSMHPRSACVRRSGTAYFVPGNTSTVECRVAGIILQVQLRAGIDECGERGRFASKTRQHQSGK